MVLSCVRRLSCWLTYKADEMNQMLHLHAARCPRFSSQRKSGQGRKAVLDGVRVMTDLLVDIGGVGFRVQVAVQQQLSMASVGLVVLHLPAVLSF